MSGRDFRLSFPLPGQPQLSTLPLGGKSMARTYVSASGGPGDSDAESRIKEAAILVVADEGLSGLSVSAVCVRAGVSEATLHLSWPDAWAVVLDALHERTTLPSLPDQGRLLDDLVAYTQAYRERCCERTEQRPARHLGP